MIRGRGVLAALGVALLGGCSDDAHPRPRDSAVERAFASAPVLDRSPDACARCHADVVDAWRGSLHAHAFDDPIFVAEYEPAPKASCRGCHDPAGGRAGAHGIDCATCHVRDGQILATSASVAGRWAHPIRVDPQLESVERCGTCHQFDHVDDGVHDPTEPLQATLDEYRRSDAARRGRTCVDCHMPRAEPGAGHALAGLGSRVLLASAVSVDVRPQQTAAGVAVEVEITGNEIGHSFPTGDVFRQGVLTLRTPGGVTGTVRMQRWQARTTDPDGLDTHVRTVDDTRVPPPGQGVLRERVVLADPDASRVDWSLRILRLDPSIAVQRGLAEEQVAVTVGTGSAPVPGR